MSRRPQILFLTHRVPYPPNRGDRIRSYHMLRFLAERAHVHLACLTEEPLEDESRRVLNELCERVHVQPLPRLGRWVKGAWSLCTGRSATQGLFASRAMQDVIGRWSRDTRFDAVFTFCSSMFQFARVKELQHARHVVDLVDVDSEKFCNYAASAPFWKRPLYRLEAGRVRQLEQAIVRKARAVTLVSEAEAAVLRRFCGSENIHAVSNGVDLEYFHPQVGGWRSEDGGRRSGVRRQRSEDGGANGDSTTHHSPLTTHQHTNPQSLSLAFVGVLDYRANLEGLRWFCRDVWPLVRRRIPNAELTLIGRRPGEAARRLAETEGVVLAGEVPDVRPHVWNAEVVIAPLTIARGIQNKVLEALAMGRPVIATPQAIEGTTAVAGEHLLSAVTPADWSAALGELADNAELRTRLSTAGRRLMETDYRWPVRLQPLENLLGLKRSESAGREFGFRTVAPSYAVS